MDAPNAIVVFAGGIKQVNGRWVSTDLTEEDNRQGAPGASLRVVASVILSNQHPSAIVIASGGKGYDIPAGTIVERPLLAEILRDELVGLGMPNERVILENSSNTTYQQLQELQALCAEKSFDRMMFLTNRWHIPRVQAMITVKFPEFATSVKLVAAEEVLLKHDREKWGRHIANAYTSDWLAQRIMKEEKGIKEIEEGTYTFI